MTSAKERSVADELLGKLKAAGRLPSPPGVAMRVLELARDENADVAMIADVIQSDPILAARLLRYANSAVVGCGREVTSIRAAVMMTGLRVVKMTCLGFSVPDPDGESVCPELDLKRWWPEGFLRATLARILGHEFFGLDREEAFTAGLLARIGQLALAQGVPKVYGPILRGVSPLEWPAAERASLGVDHVEFGARLLEEWELPDRLVTAVEHQLDPSRASEEGQPLARTLNLVGRLAPLFPTGPKRKIEPDRFRMAFRAVESELGLDEETWREIAERVLDEFREVARIFDIRLESSAQAIDLYAEAQRESVRLGLVLQLEQTALYHKRKEELRHAGTDELTGIANRARFEQRLDELLCGLRRAHTDFALVIFDVDKFADFDATYGREVSDQILVRLGRAVNHQLRDTDFIARHGSDEFAVIAPDTDGKGAILLADRLRTLAERLRVNPGGTPVGVTISLGVVVSSDYKRVPTLQQVMIDADVELMRSKASGRNAFTFRGKTHTREPALEA